MKVLIVVAMEDEKQGILKLVDYDVDYYKGFDYFKFNINNSDCILVKTDVGKTNAAILCSLFITKFKPMYVINAGIGGSLCENIPVLSTVYATKVAYHDFDLTAFGLPKGQLDNHELYFRCSRKLSSFATNDDYRGLIVSGDSFMHRKDQLDDIKKYFPKALACDMEGASIAHTADLFKRKFIVMRTISDNIYHKFNASEYEFNKNKAIEIVANKLLNILKNL